MLFGSTMINVLILGFAFASRIPGDNSDVGLENEGLYQGDIAGEPVQFSSFKLLKNELPAFPFRAAIPNTNRLWLNKTVNYQLENSISHLRESILEAMVEVQSKTCIRFLELSGSRNIEDYVTITRRDGCWSSMGRQGGEQILSLGTRCENKGIILHELMHTLGFGHQHTRSDRDDHININWDNIKSGEKHNFVKLLPWENNLLDEPFDFKSVMMYGNTAFSDDGTSATVTSKKDPFEILPDVAQKTELSAGDVKKINKLYECFGEQRPPHPKVPPFLCTFESSDCEILNQQENGLALFSMKSGTTGSLSGDHSTPSGTGTYMVTSSSTANGLPARLITPRFNHFERDYGCLSFYLHSSSAESFKVYIQTESEMAQIVSVNRDTDSQWQQHEAEISVDEKFRFIFEGIVGSSGVIALDDISFTWKQC